MIPKKIISTFLIFSLSVNAFSQTDKNWQNKIDSIIQIKEPVNFNGVVLINKNSKTVYSKAFGFSDIENKTPLKINDQFEIMSNTKQITSVLVLKEVEKGKIDLQTPIKKYLPELKQTWADSVTVHQLLNHTHGITDLEKPLAFKPGTDFKYGNLSNILLGKIIEKTSKKTYRQLATELFKQLKMNDTFCYSKNDRKDLVRGYINKENKFSKVENSMINEENLPADGVITTAKDLIIWNDQLHKGKILSPKSYQLMTSGSARSQHDVFGKEKMGYGYNIRIVEVNGIQYLGHTGLGDGFSSLNIYVPKADLHIIVLENQMNENSDLFYHTEKLIKDIVFESELVKTSR
ncbi:beta-lactamase family protein [Chryseobacterium sp. LC2016-27]|uniref:serine hydrolase domain-containing protein n=1 Tax=Chryseobacterium sp. LC2016-27 TaxID=2897326 RepID=UPI001E5D6D0C|nr:serine hydrolase domain-containing protein [Chryseobacterium sp. LC2016-27]MCD0456055.1 beta-lactamase family protein [Chryseobacterium sp. LC2016-27]